MCMAGGFFSYPNLVAFLNCGFEVLHCELVFNGHLFDGLAYDMSDSVGPQDDSVLAKGSMPDTILGDS